MERQQSVLPTERRKTGALVWLFKLAAAVILFQTLYFKFTYAPETAYIFESRGGRPAATLVGVFELIAVILLLLPGQAALGALLALGLMSGAILTHLTSLGLEVQNSKTGEGDGGLLFGLAVTVAVCSSVILIVRRHELPLVGRWFQSPPDVQVALHQPSAKGV